MLSPYQEARLMYPTEFREHQLVEMQDLESQLTTDELSSQDDYTVYFQPVDSSGGRQPGGLASCRGLLLVHLAQAVLVAVWSMYLQNSGYTPLIWLLVALHCLILGSCVISTPSIWMAEAVECSVWTLSVLGLWGLLTLSWGPTMPAILALQTMAICAAMAVYLGTLDHLSLSLGELTYFVLVFMLLVSGLSVLVFNADWVQVVMGLAPSWPVYAGLRLRVVALLDAEEGSEKGAFYEGNQSFRRLFKYCSVFGGNRGVL